MRNSNNFCLASFLVLASFNFLAEFLRWRHLFNKLDKQSAEPLLLCCAMVQVPTSKILYSDFNLVNWQLMQTRGEEKNLPKATAEGENIAQTFIVCQYRDSSENKLPSSERKLWARKVSPVNVLWRDGEVLVRWGGSCCWTLRWLLLVTFRGADGSRVNVSTRFDGWLCVKEQIKIPLRLKHQLTNFHLNNLDNLLQSRLWRIRLMLLTLWVR